MGNHRHKTETKVQVRKGGHRKETKSDGRGPKWGKSLQKTTDLNPTAQ